MEEGAADKLPRERRKKRKRRKNGRQVHHFRTRRQAKHYLHLKTEKGREPPLRLPMRRDEKEDARQHRQRQEDARKERRRRRRKRVGGPKNSTSEPERQTLPPLSVAPREERGRCVDAVVAKRTMTGQPQRWQTAPKKRWMKESIWKRLEA